MYKIIEKMKKKSKLKKIILIIVAIILLSVCIISVTIEITRQIKIKQLENKPLLEYEIKQKIDSKKYQILVKVNSTEGIESIKYVNQNNKEIQLNTNGKLTVGIDYVAEDNKDYNFTIKIKGKEEKTETLHFEIPRIQGKYTLNNGLYVNEPDLTGYNENYTRYLNVDSTGNLVIGNWINQEKSENWYNYKNNEWANIYVEKNGLETYYVWIPRYEFYLDQTNQRSVVKFLSGTSRDVDTGYQIPDAFWFDKNENGKEDDGEQLTGYWMTKYTLGAEAGPTFDTEVVATSSSIKTKGITGTKVGEGQKYRYYINGEYKGEKTSKTDTFEFSELSSNTKYTVLVEVRDSSTDEYVGTVVKQISTIDANKPELTGFNSDNTYYVLYDENENEIVGDKIKNNGSNIPNNWYSYSESKWANIVVTDGTVKNGKIENATKTTYYTWIPRYEFTITSSQQAQPAEGRTEVRFISGTSKETDTGYQIPDAFWFDKNNNGIEDNGEQLTGYWMTKYTLGN